MLTLLDGQPGSGKSYAAVNHFLLDVLKLERGRPVVLNLPIKRDALILEVVRQTKGTKRSPVIRNQVREELEKRIIELQPGFDVVRDGKSDIPTRECAAWLIDWETKFVEVETWENGVKERKFVFDSTRRPTPGPLVKDTLSEFWYFTPPNAYVIFDEAADQYNNKNRVQNAQTTLGEYVRQHRHFKDDLLFITQSFEDLDKQFRSKFELIYRCSNSLKENMFPWKWAQGLKWPFHFIFIRQYLRRGNKLILENSIRLWPKSWGFALYESFSKPRHQFGKADLKGDERSSDYKPPFWYRVREFITRARDLLFLSIGACVGIFMVGKFMWEMLHTDSNQVAKTLKMDQGGGAAPAAAAGATNSISTATNGTVDATKEAENANDPNKPPPEPPKPKVRAVVGDWVYFDQGGAQRLTGLDAERLRDVLDFLGIWTSRVTGASVPDEFPARPSGAPRAGQAAGDSASGRPSAP